MLAVPLRYGARTNGVIFVSKLGLDQFDEDDQRLLEVLAGHAAIALENASLYEAQRREAEAAKALLEFSRELVAPGRPRRGHDADRRRASARVLGSPHASVWLQRADDRRARGPRRLGRGRRADRRDHRPPAAARRGGVPRRAARRRSSSSPSSTRLFVDGPVDAVATASSPSRRSSIDGRSGAIAVATRADERVRRARAGAARRARAPGQARDHERVALREHGADVPLHGRGARERARGQRRVHVVARALDHRPGDPRRRRSSASMRRR